MDKKDKSILVFNPLKNFPFFEEDFWGFDVPGQSGLSVYEDKGHIYVEADLPRLTPEDIEITMEKGALWIRGERKEEEKDRGKKYYKKASTSFSYRVQLPRAIDEQKEPEVTYEEGVVKIGLVKSPESQVRQIKINQKARLSEQPAVAGSRSFKRR